MMDETYVLKPGKKWEIDYEVMLNPKTPLNPGKQQEEYLQKATEQQLQQYQQALAEKQLTNPMLSGWKISSLSIKKYELVRCTTFSCIQETNNAGYRIKVDYAMIVDGTNAGTSLTINVANYTTWWDHDVFWLSAFLKEMWKTSPFFTLYSGVKWLGYKLYQAGKAIVNWGETVIDWIKNNWKLALILVIAVLFVFLNGRGGGSTLALFLIVGIVAYWLYPDFFQSLIGEFQSKKS